MFYIFVENGNLNGCGECRCLNENTINIEVQEGMYNDYLANPSKYIFKDDKIVENPDLFKYKSQKFSIGRNRADKV